MTWRQYFTTTANRRRALIALCLGLFSQASGSSPVYLYLIKVLRQAGITDPHDQNAFNMGLTAWSLLNSMLFSFVMTKFKRRTMFITSMIGIVLVYITLTVSAAQFAKTGSKAAGTMTLVSILLFSPCYNLSFIVLPYSISPLFSPTG